MHLDAVPFRFAKRFLVLVGWIGLGLAGDLHGEAPQPNRPPHIVLVMADDLGWGQTGYNGHPVLKTPNLDAMAAAGMRMNRFYAGAPVCSPTRASVLTGRTPRRDGVPEHGYALHRNVQTLPQVLHEAGYTSGHFGKWHLDGLRGPGVPILAGDPFSPGNFGFDHWLSVTNFFDRDPLLSRMGHFEQFEGDSSEVVVAEAIEFLKGHACPDNHSSTLTVIWFGSPHSPFIGGEADLVAFADQDDASANQHAEIVAMDRAIGELRSFLQKQKIADQTLLWFCSDNGGLGNIRPSSVGDLRGHKGQLYEGGIRVPCVIEWPGKIHPGTVCDVPACTMDLLPTVAEISGTMEHLWMEPLDGMSIAPWFDAIPESRDFPIPFWYRDRVAVMDDRYKLIRSVGDTDEDELYDLVVDPTERNNLIDDRPEIAKALREDAEWIVDSVTDSSTGNDYPEGQIDFDHPEPRFWTEAEEYAAYLPLFWHREDIRAWGIKSKRYQPNKSSTDP